jgi:hypothetical protein
MRFEKTDPRARTTRIGGIPTPIFGNKIAVNNEYGCVPMFVAQIVLPDNKLVQVFTDPDITNGDWGNYLEAYAETAEDNPHFQHSNPVRPEDIIDFSITEGQELPKCYDLEEGDFEKDGDYSLQAWRPLDNECKWYSYDDTPPKFNEFLLQVPDSIINNNYTEGEDADLSFGSLYLFKNKANQTKIIWQFEE